MPLKRLRDKNFGKGLVMRLVTGLTAVAALAAAVSAGAAEAAIVRPTFMVAPRVLTPDTPRFQSFGTELPPCRKEKRQKKATVTLDDERSPCRRVD